MRPQLNPSLPQAIDSTIMSAYLACDAKGFWEFQRKLGPKGGSIDLVAGGAFAKGLEVARKLLYGPAKAPITTAVEKGCLAAIEHWGDFELDPNAPPHKQQKNIDRVVLALPAYFERFNPYTDQIQPYMVDGEPSVEFTFSIPMPVNHPETGEPFLWAGRFDMLGVRQGSLVVVDEKTTSQLGPTWVTKWNLRGQFTGYIWACQQFGLPVLGAIVRGVSFLKDNYGFAESPQLRAQWQIDQWFEQRCHDLERLVERWKSGWYNQVFDEACADFSGCPFQRLCSAQNPEEWIDGHYALREWDPLAKNPAGDQHANQQIETVRAPEELRALAGKL